MREGQKVLWVGGGNGSASRVVLALVVMTISVV